MVQQTNPPTSFWGVAIFALLWSIFEIYFSSFEMNIIEQSATVDEFRKIESLPLWYLIIFIVALLSEMIGCFMLFLRQKIARIFFGISLVALLFVELYWLLFLNVENTSILFSIIIPLIVISVAAFLYFYSKLAYRKGWIN